MSSTTQKPKSKVINPRDFDSLKYDTVDASTSKDNLIQSNDIIEFIPVEKKVKKTSKYEIVSNDITPEAISLSSPKFSYNKNDFKISRGSKPSKGFRSFSSVSGIGMSGNALSKFLSQLNKRLSRVHFTWQLLQEEILQWASPQGWGARVPEQE